VLTQRVVFVLIQGGGQHQSGTEVTVASVKQSISGSFDSGTRGNLLLDLPHNVRLVRQDKTETATEHRVSSGYRLPPTGTDYPRPDVLEGGRTMANGACIRGTETIGPDDHARSAFRHGV
jgi:hypothetical protein